MHVFIKELYSREMVYILFVVVFMPPTSNKLRGHIGLGLSVQSVSQSVCL